MVSTGTPRLGRVLMVLLLVALVQIVNLMHALGIPRTAP